MDATPRTLKTTLPALAALGIAFAGGVGIDAAGGNAGAAELVARNSAFAMLTTINVRVPRTAPCHRIDEVNAALFPSQSVVGYDFAGGDATALAAALDVPLAGTSRNTGATPAAPAAETALIRVVLIFQSREAIAFEFGDDGCHSMTRDLSLDEMGRAFDKAGLRAPFGTTYYQGTGRAI